MTGLFYRVRFDAWLSTCIRDGYRLIGWDWSPCVGDVAVLWRSA